jgi:hypothetical protein
MQNIYTAEYRKGEITIKAFLTRQANPNAALDLIERYAEHSQEYGQGYKRMKKDGVEFVLCDMGGTFDVIIQKNRLVFGVISVEDQDIAMEMAFDLWILDNP